MLDIKKIKSDPQKFKDFFKRRNVAVDIDQLIKDYDEMNAIKHEIETLQAQRNQLAKSATPHDPANIQLGREIRDQIDSKTQNFDLKTKNFHEKMMNIPNTPWDDVADEETEVKQYGNISLSVESTKWVQSHERLASKWGQFHQDFATLTSGTRFAALSGSMARLERALEQFILDHNTAHGYHEYSVPFLVKTHCMEGVGMLPKFHEDAFSTQNDLWLISTAEVVLTNIVREQLISEQDLHEKFPLRLTACTPCFRSEAGSAGRDQHGLIRLHQFKKVELVHICHPDHEVTEHERMRSHIEKTMELLQIPYRTIILPAHDYGFSSHKTYDIEAWMPAQNKYREISSCSACGDFQSRRMNARFKNPVTASEKTSYFSTLNGSCLPIGRLMATLLENNQRQDGSVVLPSVLTDYLNGCCVIDKNGVLQKN